MGGSRWHEDLALRRNCVSSGNQLGIEDARLISKGYSEHQLSMKTVVGASRADKSSGLSLQ